MDKFNLDIPRAGYVILFKKKDRDFFANQIKKEQMKRGFTEEQAEYVHCTISCGGQWIVEVAPPRVRIMDMREKYKGRYIKILRYDNARYELEQDRKHIPTWAASQCNKRYDWFGALAFKFKLLWQWASRPFCSENCLYSFKWEFPRFSSLLPEDCMPAHWFEFNGMKLHWEGIIE